MTRVAYPLGAVFTRESLKDNQRESNALLADQLEQAVLQVAQSDIEGASEVQAVLDMPASCAFRKYQVVFRLMLRWRM